MFTTLVYFRIGKLSTHIVRKT